MILFSILAVNIFKSNSYCNFSEIFNDNLYQNPDKKCINKLLDRVDNGDYNSESRLFYKYYMKYLKQGDIIGCIPENLNINFDEREIKFILKYFRTWRKYPYCDDIDFALKNGCFPKNYEFKWHNMEFPLCSEIKTLRIENSKISNKEIK